MVHGPFRLHIVRRLRQGNLPLPLARGLVLRVRDRHIGALEGLYAFMPFTPSIALCHLKCPDFQIVWGNIAWFL